MCGLMILLWIQGVLQEWPHSDRKLVDTALELIRQDLLRSTPIRVSLSDVSSGGDGEYLLKLTLTGPCA